MERWDAVVIGASGGVGAAALLHLARRGQRVLGLDRFEPGHARGSSHGETRIIRLAYMESPEYVPLLRRSFALWTELEKAAREQLYHEVGLLQIGPIESAVLHGVQTSADEHGLVVERLEAREIARRYPAFRVPDGWDGLLDPRAGWLWVERCVLALAGAARAAGAELRTGVAVRGWRADGPGVIVETDRGPVSAARLVIAAGPWAAQLLRELELPLVVRRKPLFWLRCEDDRYLSGPCPTWLFQLPDRSIFYGFPRAPGQATLKCAEHTGGRDLTSDPLDVDRELDEGELARVRAFVAAHLPGVRAELAQHAVCMYTLTPDEHFVVDLVPGAPHVAFACGLSGHGFKMVPALGEALAQLVLDGRAQVPIGFMGLGRAALLPGAPHTGLL